MINLMILASALLIPDLIEPADPLCIDSTGSRWRRPVHTDAVEYSIVAGTWRTPVSGQKVTLADGTERSWRPLDPEKQPNGPRGGYVVYTFNANESYPAILDARGHSFAYVNGEPRGGDVYNRGTQRMPFMVREGTNELIFRSGRGPIKPRIRSAESVASEEMSAPSELVVFLGKQDQTLPDLVKGEPANAMASMLVYNLNDEDLDNLFIDSYLNGTKTSTPLTQISAMSFLKVPFAIDGVLPEDVASVDVEIVLRDGDLVLDREIIPLRIRDATDLHKRTFKSDIDGSIQYYAVRSAKGSSDSDPGIALSLHGASVEAQRQASCYRPREWVHVVAPTNRRPFGFDWEHWGRLDAMEALEDAEQRYPNDPSRRWLTGHSMGGHGTWQLGATFPDRWAAIAPSAGWVSFWTYGGPDRYQADGGLEEVLRRAANPSDTLLMRENLDQFGIYILHGDKDDNVPVEQARMMRSELATSHPDWAYYERPGAGHWWGDQCMDWPPLFDFLKERKLPDPGTVDDITFVTVDPRASSTNHWAQIRTQHEAMNPSRIQLRRDIDSGTVSGATQNVRRLVLDLSDMRSENSIFKIDIDDSEIEVDGTTNILHLVEENDGWSVTDPPSLSLKGPHRAGPFRDAFNNEVVLVYGTLGTNEETSRLASRARLDSERWWYRANGHLPFISDAKFNPDDYPDRNIVLYGNADTNSLWSDLLSDSPIQVRRKEVRIGNNVHSRDDLSVLFIRPRPGSETASVGVVASSGLTGERLSNQHPLFLAGVGWPDWIVFSPNMLNQGIDGVVDAGFFDEDWSLNEIESH